MKIFVMSSGLWLDKFSLYFCFKHFVYIHLYKKQNLLQILSSIYRYLMSFYKWDKIFFTYDFTKVYII